MHTIIVISRTLSQYDNMIDSIVHKDSQVFNLTWCMSYHYLTNKKNKIKLKDKKSPNNLQTKTPIQVRTLNEKKEVLQLSF